MIALDSIEIIDKDNIQVSWFDNGNHWETWDSGELFSHIVEQYDEIERLNNIINKFEKYIDENYIYDEVGMKIFDASELQDKLQELKGSE